MKEKGKKPSSIMLMRSLYFICHKSVRGSSIQLNSDIFLDLVHSIYDYLTLTDIIKFISFTGRKRFTWAKVWQAIRRENDQNQVNRSSSIWSTLISPFRFVSDNQSANMITSSTDPFTNYAFFTDHISAICILQMLFSNLCNNRSFSSLLQRR